MLTEFSKSSSEYIWHFTLCLLGIHRFEIGLVLTIY
jgi:hypothetical protein